MRKVPTIPDDRNRHAETWQRLADVRLSVPGHGRVTVAQMLESVSASGNDPATRAQLLRELDDLAAILSPLPAAARDEVIEKIIDAIREAYGDAA